MPPVPKTPRTVTAIRWQGLALFSAASLAAAAPVLADAPHVQTATERLWLAQTTTEGGEGGEGGESGAPITPSDAVTQAQADAAYLASLGFIEGKLRVGTALYLEGEAEMAKPHLTQPADALYADLEPQLAARGIAGFAPELLALAGAVETGAAPDAVQAAFDAVMARLAMARAAETSPRAAFDAMLLLMRDAADDYAAGVTDGKLTDAHEYQDAWGYVQAVRAMASALTASPDPIIAKACARTLEALAETDAAFAGLAPDGPVPGDATLLQGAAARVELAASKVK